MAEASRSKSVPVVVRTSQPRPTVTAVRPGASLVSETLPPLDRLTAMGSPFPRRVRAFVPSRKLPSPVLTQTRDHEVPARFTFFAELLAERSQNKVTDGPSASPRL